MDWGTVVGITVVMKILHIFIDGWISWADYNWTWAKEYPFYGAFAAFALFGLTFAAYGAWRQGYSRGAWDDLKLSQRVCFAAIFLPFAIPAYLVDIFVMRVLVCGIFFGVKPWQEDWRMLSASWTFSRFVTLYERSPGKRGDFARWWRPILHFLSPTDH